jgi:hypothetical protein
MKGTKNVRRKNAIMYLIQLRIKRTHQRSLEIIESFRAIMVVERLRSNLDKILTLAIKAGR